MDYHMRNLFIIAFGVGKVMMNEEYFDISFIIENIGFRTATEIGQVYMRHVDEEKRILWGLSELL